MFQKLRQTLCNLVPQRDSGIKPDQQRTSSLNVFCFIAFGTLTFFNQEMLYTATEDLLSGRSVATAAVLVTFVAPMMTIKMLFPWCIQKVPYWLKIFLIPMFMMSGILMIAYSGDIRVQMIGVGLNAMATGASELIFLSLSSFYPQICISAYVAGTGLSSLVSPLYYTGKFNNFILKQSSFVCYIFIILTMYTIQSSQRHCSFGFAGDQRCFSTFSIRLLRLASGKYY